MFQVRQYSVISFLRPALNCDCFLVLDDFHRVFIRNSLSEIFRVGNYQAGEANRDQISNIH